MELFVTIANSRQQLSQRTRPYPRCQGSPKSDSYFRHFKFAELDPYQYEANIPLI